MHLHHYTTWPWRCDEQTACTPFLMSRFFGKRLAAQSVSEEPVNKKQRAAAVEPRLVFARSPNRLDYSKNVARLDRVLPGLGADGVAPRPVARSCRAVAGARQTRRGRVYQASDERGSDVRLGPLKC